MYEFELKDNERILYENNDIYLNNNEDILNIAIMITDLRLILFRNENTYSYKETVKLAAGVNYISKYEIIFETEKEKIKFQKYEDGINYIENDDKKIQLICENIEIYLK